jgi:hypothetical protein
MRRTHSFDGSPRKVTQGLSAAGNAQLNVRPGVARSLGLRSAMRHGMRTKRGRLAALNTGALAMATSRTRPKAE